MQVDSAQTKRIFVKWDKMKDAIEVLKNGGIIRIIKNFHMYVKSLKTTRILYNVASFQVQALKDWKVISLWHQAGLGPAMILTQFQEC